MLDVVVSWVLTAIFTITPSLVASATHGAPTALALARSHAMYLPPLLVLLLPSRFVSDLRVEHILRHASYAMAASVSAVGVELSSWNANLTLFYIAMQCGLYMFSVTHWLEYKGLATSRTHYGDTPVLSLLLLSMGIFIGRGGVEYVFLKTVLFAIPLRVALSTLMLLAHADFASHSTTRLEDPAFYKCSSVGVMLSCLFLSFVEAECPFGLYTALPIFAAAWVMYLDVSAPPRIPTAVEIASLLLTQPLVLATAVLFYEKAMLVMALGALAVVLFGFFGLYMLSERSYVPTALLGAFWVMSISHAWDPTPDVIFGIARGAAWVITFAASSWTMNRLAQYKFAD